MSLARLVVTAVRIEGRTKAEVGRDYGVSPRWVYELVRRFDAEGEAGLAPRSRRPRHNPYRVSAALEDEIVELRKDLLDLGVDAGAHTIAVHLERRHGQADLPSVATIWRVLSRRGFVTPQPQKRPKSSFVRFEADQPNERWQADITHWRLADGSEVEILDMIDPAETIEALQAQLDRFSSYYNEVRPHRALGPRTPAEAFAARPKAGPSDIGLAIPGRFRVRRDKIDITGVVTIRHNSRLHHIGLGRRLIGTRVLVLIDGLQIRVISEDGELIRELTLDTSRDYQPHGRT
jgi:transposase InsO family protein